MFSKCFFILFTNFLWINRPITTPTAPDKQPPTTTLLPSPEGCEACRTTPGGWKREGKPHERGDPRGMPRTPPLHPQPLTRPKPRSAAPAAPPPLQCHAPTPTAADPPNQVGPVSQTTQPAAAEQQGNPEKGKTHEVRPSCPLQSPSPLIAPASPRHPPAGTPTTQHHLRPTSPTTQTAGAGATATIINTRAPTYLHPPATTKPSTPFGDQHHPHDNRPGPRRRPPRPRRNHPSGTRCDSTSRSPYASNCWCHGGLGEIQRRGEGRTQWGDGENDASRLGPRFNKLNSFCK